MIAADKSVNLLDEYEILQRILSGSVHASPSTVIWAGMAPKPDLCMLAACNLTLRVAGRLAACRRVPLDTRAETVIKAAWEPIL